LGTEQGHSSDDTRDSQLAATELAPEETPGATESSPEGDEGEQQQEQQEQQQQQQRQKGPRQHKERLAEIFQSLPIPKGRVGWIIGKQGFNIQGLESKSGCAISVSDSPSREFGQEWSYIQLQGTTRAVDRAKKLIYLRLESFPGQGQAERRYNNNNGGRQTNMHRKQHQQPNHFQNQSSNPTAAMHVHHAQDPLSGDI
jgi:hypothetical protein